MNYIYGPVPSRRMGISLGVSPIPKKTCNYSCVYCQLGRTNHMTQTRNMFYSVASIIKEFEQILTKNIYFDVVTIVGEGEPTLYLGLGELIKAIKQRTTKPVAVITNGALLYQEKVRNELSLADIVLPTFDAFDEVSFKKINRPHGSISYSKMLEGLITFSNQYKGQLWLEMMFIKDINDSENCILAYSKILRRIHYDKLYLNTPVRPPAENYIQAVTSEKMKHLESSLQGISIDLLHSEGFYSDIEDHQKAILSIIKRHPMNQHEIKAFLTQRKCDNPEQVIKDLLNTSLVEVIEYKNYQTFRLK